MAVIKLNEDISRTIPDWARNVFLSRGFRSQESRNSNLQDIALDKVKFIEDDLPRSNRDPRLKDPSRLNIYKFATGDTAAMRVDKVIKDGRVVPGVYDQWADFSRCPWKHIVNNTVEFGYIDLNDPENFNTDLVKSRVVAKRGSDLDKNSMFYRDRGQYRKKDTEYVPSHYDEDGKYVYGYEKDLGTYSWVTDKGQDKSGYKLDPQRLVRKLDHLGLDNYASRLNSYYKKLEAVRSEIIEKLQSAKIGDRVGDSEYSDTKFRLIKRALDSFETAADRYSQTKKNIERAIEKDDFDEYSASLNMFLNRLGEVRAYLEDAREWLDKLN